MCGRYVASREPATLVAEFAVDQPPAVVLPPRYNIAPTNGVYVIRESKEHVVDDRHLRLMEVARWGLVPRWAKDPSIGNRMINARAETVAEKPAYRRAFASRRCIVPADGFYEWQKTDGRSKQPYFLRPADGSSLAMAGLYEWWRDPAIADGDDPHAWLLSTTILTMTAAGAVGRIHERMPVVVPADIRDDWLDPETPGGDVLPAVEVAPPSDFWDIRPVSTEVNSVRHDGPDLIRPLDGGGGE